jgi:ACT domain-containing protein
MFKSTANPEFINQIVEQVVHEYKKKTAHGQTPAAVASSAPQKIDPPTSPYPECVGCKRGVHQKDQENIIITAAGVNRKGIISNISTKISEFDGDIRDINQTITGKFFTMIMIVDIGGPMRQGKSFADLKNSLQEIGKSLGIEVMVQHENIMDRMHRV